MNPSLEPANRPLGRRFDAWNAFWFTPQDPTLLGLMRIFAGMVTLYTFVIHGFTLPTLMGENAWYGLALRNEMIADRAVSVGALLSSPLHESESLPAAGPANEAQVTWANAYKANFGAWPPAPHPANQAEADFSFNFRRQFGYDFRYYGLPFPKNEWEKKVLNDYVATYGETFPPPYPAKKEEVELIKKFRDSQKQDPRRIYARGIPAWSVWLHVTDPFWMNVVQASFVAAALCFLLGLGTRVTSVIVWFANLCYIHRNPAMLFGVDTMMTVLLLYLMIGPSGAALSLDRVIARWWRRAGGDNPLPPAPSVSANVAIRMMQIHLCIIYLISGLGKLQGQTWWNGSAVWNVLGNFEFAPMHLKLYNDALRFLGHNQLLFETCITGAGLSTLVFEISYAFLVWRPSTRWFMLAGAIFLHGFIGLFMGLKTFSLMMLVFNMAFLRPSEVAWLLSWFKSAPPASRLAATPVRRKHEAVVN
jgi:hypothetical protein